MDRELVSSSNVESVGWSDGILEVSFLNGGIYQYYDVPEDVYNSMLIADSVGSFLHHHVKGFYDYAKVS